VRFESIVSIVSYIDTKSTERSGGAVAVAAAFACTNRPPRKKATLGGFIATETEIHKQPAGERSVVMPYPSDAPRNKHDLLGPSEMMVDPTYDLNEFVASYAFRTADEMFHMLHSQVQDPSHFASTKSAKIESLSAVYSYSNAPDPPLSRSLLVVGVASSSQPWVQHLLEERDPSESVMHRCTIAVKRLRQSGLAPKDVMNSQSFSSFVRALRKHRQVAIVAPDKYQRFALVSPDDSDQDDDTDIDGDGACYAHLYVGKIDDVQRALAERAEHVEPVTSSPRYDPSTPPWQPSTPPINDAPEWQPSTPPLPPDHDDNDAGSSSLWQPPGGSTTGNDEGGDGSGLWQPPTDSDAPGDTYSYGGSGDANNYGNSWDTGGGGGGDAGVKRPRSGSDDNGGEGEDDDGEGRRNSQNQFHTDSGAAAADAFYSGLTRTLDTRADSRIYHMRAFNGWVKATQIQELDPQTLAAAARSKRRKGGGSEGGGAGGKPLRILDLACGKGGDLGKWILHPRGIANYVGIDVARG
jgi:mRNA capping enzyme